MTAAIETIFLVDDDPGVRKALSRVLHKEGWNIETFESAEAVLARDVSARQVHAEIAGFEHRLATLTSREREVLAAVVKGKLNKQIAGDLGVVEQTVKFHRARIMERMQARTVAELMHMTARLGIEAAAAKPRATPPPDKTAPKPPRS